MHTNKKANAAARRIAKRVGVKSADVMKAYRNAAHGAPVNVRSLFLDTVPPVTFGETADAVTVTITGAAFANLEKIARAMNGVSWCDDDNTPATVLEGFLIGHTLNALSDHPERHGKIRAGGVCGQSAWIVESIETNRERGTPEDTARRAELRAAFDAVGV